MVRNRVPETVCWVLTNIQGDMYLISIRQASGKGITQMSLPQSALENLKQEEIWFIIQSRGFCLTLCDPRDCSTPGSPVLQYLPEFAQIHVHQVSDAIQPTVSSSATPSPQSFPTSGAFRMSWVFASGVQSIGALLSASVLLMNIQGWFPLGLTDLISLLSKGLLRVFSSSTVGKHQFFSAQPSLWFNCHIGTWLLEKPWFWLFRPLSLRWCLCFLMCYLGLS